MSNKLPCEEGFHMFYFDHDRKLMTMMEGVFSESPYTKQVAKAIVEDGRNMQGYSWSIHQDPSVERDRRLSEGYKIVTFDELINDAISNPA